MDTLNAQPAPAPTAEVHRFNFDGKGSELFLIMLVNYILTVLTLGIYSFWGRTRTRKYIWSHFTFMGDRLEYTGTGRELFVSALKVGGAFIVFYFINKLILSTLPVLAIPMSLLFYVVLFLLIGFAQYSARNYRLARTRWRGIRLGMTSARKEYMKTYVIWTILTGLTLGLAAPVRWVKLRSILVGNTRVGTMQLRYTGDVKEIYWKYIGGFILMILTLGIYGFWHRARLMRYDYDHTYLGNSRFKCLITGGDLLFVGLAGALLVLVSFGLATPWALNLWMQTYADNLAVLGDVPLEQIAQAPAEGSALGEELAEFLDVDFGF